MAEEEKKPSTFYTEQLNEFTCDVEGCDCGASDRLFLVSKCHPDAGVDVQYKKGMLHVTCHECKEPVINVAVGSMAERN